MSRKTRPIFATLAVLAFTVLAYIHSAPHVLDLANPGFNFYPDDAKLEDIPEAIRQMDGQLVSAEGYMIPIDNSDPITSFTVVAYPWNFEFHGDHPEPPMINQTALVHFPVGLTYNPERIRVTGKLHVRFTKDDGYIISIFEMDADRIETVYAGPFAKWPWFIVAGIPAIIVLETLRRWQKRRRRRLAGHCIRCGYDLRATPARCPECGLQTGVTIPA